MTTITVDLGSRSYPIHVESGLLESLSDIMKSLQVTGSVGLVSNRTVFQHYGRQVEDSIKASGCEVITAFIPDGEKAKNQSIVSALYDAFLDGGLDRGSTLIALGGGVVGDITGFAAATLFRGIPYLQIPTSLLAMVDASIGGKTGINHPSGKNLIGAFHQPVAVVIDPKLVHTLPRREITAATAEIIKTAVIADDSFFHELSANIENLTNLSDIAFLEESIIRSCEIKAEVVSGDEREGDRRRILNFGHTIGHALETALSYSGYLHGEAVAIGMVGAAYLSTQVLDLPLADNERIVSTLTALEIPSLPTLDEAVLLEVFQHDKKVRDGVLHFILLQRIGQPIITDKIGEPQLLDAIHEIQRRFE